MMPQRVLSLDLATATGFAYGNVDAGEPVSGSFRVKDKGIGPFARAFDLELGQLIDRADPTMIVFEAPMVSNTGNTPLATAIKLYGLAWHVEFVATQRGLPIVQEYAQTWKSAVVGGQFGKKPKTGVNPKTWVYPPFVACRHRGWTITDDNEADALCLWLFAVGRINPRAAARFDPLARVGLVA